MPNPLINIGTAVGDGTGTPGPRTWSQLINRLPNPDSTINAGSGDYVGTTEAKITLAIADAVIKGYKYVWVPQSMLPYNASLVTFNTAVRMIREGGNPEVFDIIAYGGKDGDVTIGVTPSFNAATAAAKAYSPQGGGIKGGVVWFPAGQWYFLTSPTNITGTMNVTFQGEGHDCSALAMGAAGVTIFPLGDGASSPSTRVTIKDLWVGSFTNYATGYGLYAVTTGWPLTPNSELIVDNVKFENLPNPVYLDNVQAAHFFRVRIQQTRAGATIGHLLYMIRSQSMVIDSMAAGCFTGSLPGDAIRIDSDCDTIMCWKCENTLLGLGASTVAFHVMDSIGGHPPRIVRITDCMGESAQVGFQVDAARDVRIRGGECALNNAQGVLITGGISVEVAGMQSFLNGTHGIHAQGGSAIDIHDCTCSNNSQAANNVSDGIVVQTSDVRCVNNRSGDVFFTNPNKQRSGLNITAGTDNLVIGGNKLQGNLGSGFEQPSVIATTGANVMFLGTALFATTPAVLAAGYDGQNVGHCAITATLTGPLTVAAPSNGIRGQRLTFTLIQDGTGGRAVTWNAAFKVSWSDTGNTLNKRSSISFIYDGTNWNQDGAQTPYV